MIGATSRESDMHDMGGTEGVGDVGVVPTFHHACALRPAGCSARRVAGAIFAVFFAAILAMSGPAPATAAPEDARAYDQKLLRLAEIMGAMHYLRELCGANDGQKWRDRIRELVRSEGSTAYRRAVISQHFNRGYRSYGRTYRTCTAPAKTTIARFLVEAVEISDDLLKLAN